MRKIFFVLCMLLIPVIQSNAQEKERPILSNQFYLGASQFSYDFDEFNRTLNSVGFPTLDDNNKFGGTIGFRFQKKNGFVDFKARIPLSKTISSNTTTTTKLLTFGFGTDIGYRIKIMDNLKIYPFVGFGFDDNNITLIKSANGGVDEISLLNAIDNVTSLRNQTMLYSVGIGAEFNIKLSSGNEFEKSGKNKVISYNLFFAIQFRYSGKIFDTWKTGDLNLSNMPSLYPGKFSLDIQVGYGQLYRYLTK